MAKKKPAQQCVYIPFEAKARGNLLLRETSNNLKILDIFPNRRKARRFLQEQEAKAGPLRLKKLRVYDLAGSMAAIPDQLHIDLLVFQGFVFPLTEAGIPEGNNGPWAKLFEAGGVHALAFATSWWWLNKAHGCYPVITEEIITDFQEQAFQRFTAYLEEWERETRFQSSSTILYGHPAFRRIVEMGEGVVPWILEALPESPLLCLALEDITGESVEHEPGDVLGHAQAWLDWGKQTAEEPLEAT